jgi:RNA polymerase sigma-70 factor (ECF subfamily)
MTDDIKQTTTTDKQLIFAALCGNNSAFGIIVERYWNMAIALALTKIADPVEAEDIAQESFLIAYSQLHKLRDPSRFAGWLSKIVSQQCINSARKNNRHKKILSGKAASLEDNEMKFACASNPGLSQSQATSIRQAVLKLPEKFRNLIIMRFVAGLTAVQIAEQLGKRPGTVRVWLHRACNILRRDLAPLFEEVTK